MYFWCASIKFIRALFSEPCNSKQFLILERLGISRKYWNFWSKYFYTLGCEDKGSNTWRYDKEMKVIYIYGNIYSHHHTTGT